MMQVVLGGARDAAGWQQGAAGTGCRCVWHGDPAADDALDADAADAAADAGDAGHHAGTGDAHVTGRVVIAAKQTPPESLPGIDRLAAPDPDARGDADRERHEVLEHQDRVERPGAWSTGTGERAEPLVAQGRLVDVTTQHHAGRQGVEDAEHADPYHELLELVSLGTGLPLDDRADAEETHEASEEEARAEQEVDEERRQDKVAHTLGGDGAHAGHRIASYATGDVRPDCLYRRRQPCHQVEVLRVRGYRLVAPLEARREEPSERQDHPPDRRRHAEEVDHEENGHARARALRARLERRTVAGDLLVAEHAARQIAHGHDEVAGRQEDDRPLRILEALGVDQKRDDGHESAGGAQAAPQCQPDGRELALFVGEERAVARQGTVRHPRDLLDDASTHPDAHHRRWRWYWHYSTYAHACQTSPPRADPAAAAPDDAAADAADRPWYRYAHHPQGHEGRPAPARAVPRPLPRGVLAVFLILARLAASRLRLARPRGSGRGARRCRGTAARGAAVRPAAAPAAAAATTAAPGDGAGTIVLLHAQVLRILAVIRQPLAGHPLRPREAVLLHERRAAGACPLADAAASRQRLRVLRQADRRVHGAQEELEVGRALDLHQRPELVHLQPGLVLRVVIQLVRHGGEVVADAAAHGDRDLLAAAVAVVAAGAEDAGVAAVDAAAVADDVTATYQPVAVAAHSVAAVAAAVRHHVDHRGRGRGRGRRHARSSPVRADDATDRTYR